MKPIQMDYQQSSSSESDGIDGVHSQSTVVPANLIATTDGFEKKEHSWFATSQIPTDLSIQVEEITFYVHKKHMAHILLAQCSPFSSLIFKTFDKIKHSRYKDITFTRGRRKMAKEESDRRKNYFHGSQYMPRETARE
ncbi:hypothetical protein ACH5RR_013096 [Cinchona calisaya]|uniref:BTB domain-containing protein n=1 Tax=Cinchona calisaya TaxID=153742 RepID=A0ABD2ZZ56_9GENT